MKTRRRATRMLVFAVVAATIVPASIETAAAFDQQFFVSAMAKFGYSDSACLRTPLDRHLAYADSIEAFAKGKGRLQRSFRHAGQAITALQFATDEKQIIERLAERHRVTPAAITLSSPPGGNWSSWRCSGVLLPGQQVLTARHCLSISNFNKVGVVLPQYSINGKATRRADDTDLAYLMDVFLNPGGKPAQEAGLTAEAQTAEQDVRRHRWNFRGQSAQFLKKSSVDIMLLKIHAQGSAARTLAYAGAVGRLKTTEIVVGHAPNGTPEMSGGLVVKSAAGRLRYRADVAGGSSGGGVFDADAKLVGIHVAGGCNSEEDPKGHTGVSKHFIDKLLNPQSTE